MWKALAIVIIVAAATPAARANGRPPMTNALAFRRGDPSALYAGTTFGLLVSPDGCRFYWLCEQDIGYGGEFDPHYAVTPTGAILATTFHGLRVSRDGGCSFQTATDDAYLDALAVGPAGEVWIGSSDTGAGNTIARSTDDAVTFTPRGALPGSLWFRSIHVAPSDAQRLYVAAFQPVDTGSPPTPPSAHWFRTDDAGATWTELPLAGVAYGNQPDLRVAAIDPAHEDTVFLTSLVANPPGDILYRSTDAGATLTEVLRTSDTITGVVVHDGTTVIAATRQGGSFLSGDGGATFSPLPGAPRLACLVQRADGVLFGCTANYEPDHMALARSSDGRSWERVASFEYIAGPLECPAGTPELDSCENDQWRFLAKQLGITPATCATGPDAGLQPESDAPPAPTGGGCCDGGASGAPVAVLAALIGFTCARRRR